MRHDAEMLVGRFDRWTALVEFRREIRITFKISRVIVSRLFRSKCHRYMVAAYGHNILHEPCDFSGTTVRTRLLHGYNPRARLRASQNDGHPVYNQIFSREHLHNHAFADSLGPY